MLARGKGVSTTAAVPSSDGEGREAKRRKLAQALLAGIFRSGATAAAIVNSGGGGGVFDRGGGNVEDEAAAARRRAELAAHAGKVMVTEKKKFAGREIE